MAILLQNIDLAPDEKRLALQIQFSADGTVEVRSASYNLEGKKLRLSPEDDLLERIRAAEIEAGLRPNAYLSELLHHTLSAIRAPGTLTYPILINGTLLRRRPRHPLREKLKSMLGLR